MDKTERDDLDAIDAAAKALCNYERGFGAWEDYTTGFERRIYRDRVTIAIDAYSESSSPDFG